MDRAIIDRATNASTMKAKCCGVWECDAARTEQHKAIDADTDARNEKNAATDADPSTECERRIGLGESEQRANALRFERDARLFLMAILGVRCIALLCGRWARLSSIARRTARTSEDLWLDVIDANAMDSAEHQTPHKRGAMGHTALQRRAERGRTDRG